MTKLLQWDEIYCFQKFLPLLTRWQIFHYSTSQEHLPVCVLPDFIKKKRSPKGVASFEIVWKDDKHLFDDLIPEDQMKTYLGELFHTFYI